MNKKKNPLFFYFSPSVLLPNGKHCYKLAFQIYMCVYIYVSTYIHIHILNLLSHILQLIIQMYICVYTYTYAFDPNGFIFYTFMHISFLISFNIVPLPGVRSWLYHFIPVWPLDLLLKFSVLQFLLQKMVIKMVLPNSSKLL